MRRKFSYVHLFLKLIIVSVSVVIVWGLRTLNVESRLPTIDKPTPVQGIDEDDELQTHKQKKIVKHKK